MDLENIVRDDFEAHPPIRVGFDPVADIDVHLYNLRVKLEYVKPGDRSALDRNYAVLLTDLEKMQAYFDVYIKGAK